MQQAAQTPWRTRRDAASSTCNHRPQSPGNPGDDGDHMQRPQVEPASPIMVAAGAVTMVASPRSTVAIHEFAPSSSPSLLGVNKRYRLSVRIQGAEQFGHRHYRHHIKTGAGEVAAAQSRLDRRKIEHGTARGVDDHGALRQQRDFVGTYRPGSLSAGCAHAVLIHQVRLPSQPFSAHYSSETVDWRSVRIRLQISDPRLATDRHSCAKA